MNKTDAFRRGRLLEQFWRRIHISPSGCWLWTGRTDRGGYGTFGRNGRATWFAYQMRYGTVEGLGRKLYICHRCDNPPCVNPAHLFVGTPSQNAWDRQLKGRGGHWRLARQRKATA